MPQRYPHNFRKSRFHLRETAALEERKEQPKTDWGRLNSAILAYQRAMDARQDLDIRSICLGAIAEIYYVVGRLDEVAKLYEEIVKLDYELFDHGDDFTRAGPVNHLDLLASVYEKLGRTQEAISAYQRIIDWEWESDESLDASLEMASLLKKTGDRVKAMEIYQKWLSWINKNEKRIPRNGANYLRGRVYLGMERYSESIASFKKAAARKLPDSIAENQYLYELYLIVGDQKAATEQRAIIHRFYEEWARPIRTGKVIKIN